MTSQQNALEIRFLAHLIFRLSSQEMEKRLAERGYSLSMLQVGLLHMLKREVFTITEISRKMHLDPSTLVPAVDALERRELVERRKDPQDRRRVPLYLTPTGNQLLNNLHQVTEDDPLYQALQELGAENTETLVVLLRRLIANFPEGEKMLQEVHQRVHSPPEQQDQ